MMIFPAHCKEVGYASEKPLDDKVYFLSRYLIHEVPSGLEILEVEAEDTGGLMRAVTSSRVLAGPEEVYLWPRPVVLHDQGGLIRKALATGRRCTVFRGADEHMTFVLDPDPEAVLCIHVYDAEPPRPNLSATIRALEATGLFGELCIAFEHHVREISSLEADVYPCRASGFERTLDKDRPEYGEIIAGCRTARQMLEECYGGGFEIINICPADAVLAEPFIARCCRSERCGLGKQNGLFGAVIHWGASPKEIADMVIRVAEEWRRRQEK